MLSLIRHLHTVYFLTVSDDDDDNDVDDDAPKLSLNNSSVIDIYIKDDVLFETHIKNF